MTTQLAPHQVPREGLAHPMLAECGERDDVRMRVYYAERVDDATFERLDGILTRWIDAEDWSENGGVPKIEEASDGRFNFWLRVSGLRRPQAPLTRFVRMLVEAGVRPQELFVTRWTVIAENGLMGPVGEDGDPIPGRMSFADQAEFLEALLAGREKVASESPMHLKGGVMGRDDKLLLEQRGAFVTAPGVRIGYGVYEKYRTQPGDERTEAVERAVAEALRAELGTAFAWGEPNAVPMPRNWERVEGAVDTIVAQGRRGYELMIYAEPLRLVEGGSSFRQREYEVVQALARVIAQLDLEPVIAWMRVSRPINPFAGPLREPFRYFFQLFEKESRPPAALPPQRDVAWPPASPEALFEEWLTESVMTRHTRRRPRRDRARIESWISAPVGGSLARFLEVRDAESMNLRRIGSLAFDDYDLLPPVAALDERPFEALLSDWRGAESLKVLTAGGIPIARLEQGHESSMLVASVIPAESGHPVVRVNGGLVIFHASDVAAAITRAWSESVGAPTPPGLLEGRIAPYHEVAPEEVSEACRSRIPSLAARIYWAHCLLGMIEQPPAMPDVVRLFDQFHAHHVSLEKALGAGHALHTPGTAFYLAATMHFTDDARLASLLDAQRGSRSPLVRDMARFFGELVAGRDDALTAPIRARKAEFLALARESAPQAIAHKHAS